MPPVGFGVLRAFDPKRRAILLVAGDKVGRGERRFYKRLIEKADKRFDIPVAREYFGKRGVLIVPESKARRGGIARPYCDESQRGYRVRVACIAAKYSRVTGITTGNNCRNEGEVNRERVDGCDKRAFGGSVHQDRDAGAGVDCRGDDTAGPAQSAGPDTIQQPGQGQRESTPQTDGR